MNPPAWSMRRRRAMLAVLVAAWLGALVATHVPIESLPRMRASDQVLHLVGFFGLASLFWLTLRAHGKTRRQRLLAILLALMAYAAFDELTQPIFGRWASFGDWNADMVGATLALAAWELASIRRRPRPA